MKTKKFTRLFVVIVLAFGSSSALASNNSRGEVIPVNLKCDYVADPIDIDITAPNLSWELKPGNPELKDLSQSSYRVLVATSKRLLKENIGDLWDSGVVKSSNSAHVIYAGRRLKSREICYWKVRVRDQDGNASRWSAIADWRTALLNMSDWSGSCWIGLRHDSRNSTLSSRPFQTSGMKKPVMKKSYASPLLRKQIEVTGTVKDATLYIAGLGYYELYLNGRKVGDHVLDPAQTDYDVYSLYATYDVTKYLKSGRNVIGVMLGNGFYGQDIAFADWLGYGKPRLRCKMWIQYKDGSTVTVTSDSTWKASTGPIEYDNVYAGETYDARREKAGWDEPYYNDSGWQQAEPVRPPNDSLRSQMLPAMKRIAVVRPVRIFKSKGGQWIIDLGQDIAGWPRIEVREKRGDKITMRVAENLNSEGDGLNFASLGSFATGVLPTYIYVCKGSGLEKWEPRFSYAGFRYIEVSGLSRRPTSNTIEGVVVHTAVERIGHFSSSSPLLNKIYDISLWTLVNNLHGHPEDCPDREKCGWLGDAHITAETDLFNFGMTRFYGAYMNDIRSNLGRGGETYKGQPATPNIPANIAPGKRVCQEARVDWGVAEILIPYYVYLYDGDIRLFKNFYPIMKDFITYVKRYEAADGIIQNGYGDWCPPGGNAKMECPPELSSTALFYRVLDILSEMAPKLGDPAYAGWCDRQKDSIRVDFNKAYLRQIPGTDYWNYGSQTADVMAYEFGLVPENKVKSLAHGLVYDIQELHDGHMTTGIFGSKFLYTALCDLGYPDVAYKVMTTPTFPSLAYLVSCGFTTWPEVPLQYKNKNVPRTASFDHAMQSGFAIFFDEGIGGIRPDFKGAGFRHFQLRPSLYNELSWAKCDYNSYYGKMKSDWRVDGHKFIWDIQIPVNTTATIYMPDSGGGKIVEDGVPVNRRPAVKFVKSEGGRRIFQLGSGTYHFVSEKGSNGK